MKGSFIRKAVPRARMGCELCRIRFYLTAI